MKNLILLLLAIIITSDLNAQEMEQPFLSGVASKGVQEYFYKSTSLSHGGFMFVAGSSLNNNGDYDIILSKFNGQVEVWSHEWNGSGNGDDFASNLTIDSSGNIVLVGATYVNGSINYDGVILKFNQNGVLLWNSTYGNPNNLLDGFVSVVADNQNSIFVCSGLAEMSVGNNARESWVMVLDQDGCLEADCGMAVNDNPESPFTIYPNPATNQLNLSWSTTTTGKALVRMTTLEGKIVLEEETTASQQHTIDTSALAEGLYLLTVQMNNTWYVEKVVVRGE